MNALEKLGYVRQLPDEMFQSYILADRNFHRIKIYKDWSVKKEWDNGQWRCWVVDRLYPSELKAILELMEGEI